MKVGIIGLGAMGRHMALNLHKRGHLHAIWNRTESKAQELAEEIRVSCAKSPRALTEGCELIITCVSRDEDVLEMVERIAASCAVDTIVADTSTTSPETSIKAAEQLRLSGAHFLDCPVSGGVEGAQQGTLAMMVGGDPIVLEGAREVLSAVADKIIYIGPTGAGQACKAVNQLMVAGINQAVTEALAFGMDMGLDMNKVIDAVSTGAAENWFLSHRGKTMIRETYDPGFKLALHHKDLEICRAIATNKGKAWPLVEMTLIHYQRLMEEGYGNEDISTLFRLKNNPQLT